MKPVIDILKSHGMATKINMLIEAEDAYNRMGTSLYSDEFCCELLSFLSKFGNNEAFVQSEALNTAVTIAQCRLNLLPGEIPNEELFELYQSKKLELESNTKTGWVKTIAERYKLMI